MFSHRIGNKRFRFPIDLINTTSLIRDRDTQTRRCTVVRFLPGTIGKEIGFEIIRIGIVQNGPEGVTYSTVIRKRLRELCTARMIYPYTCAIFIVHRAVETGARILIIFS